MFLFGGDVHFDFCNTSQVLYPVAVLLRRIQPPLTALGSMSFPLVQMYPAVLTENQQNVSMPGIVST